MNRSGNFAAIEKKVNGSRIDGLSMTGKKNFASIKVLFQIRVLVIMKGFLKCNSGLFHEAADRFVKQDRGEEEFNFGFNII
jgi:hypothetical protein